MATNRDQAMLSKWLDKQNLIVAGTVIAVLITVAFLGGCGGISTQQEEESTTTTVIVECVIEGTDELIEVPADVVAGGVRGQTNLEDDWVILENVPLGSQNPPQQPLTATAPGYATESQMLTLNEFSYTAVSVPMSPVDTEATGTVSGMVTDGDTGQPIVNALVSFLPPGGLPSEAVKGSADTAGFYVIGGIPAQQVHGTCQAVGYMEASIDVWVTADAVGSNGPLDFALVGGESTVTVSGQVLDTRTEAAISGATVQIGDQPPVLTGSDGIFSISHVSVGEQPVEASASGYDDYYTVIEVVPGIDDLIILLNEYSPQPPGPPYTIAGRVTLLGVPDNSGATVTATDIDSGQMRDDDVTDADGYYYLFVPPGYYRIEVTYSSHSISREVELLGGGRVLEGINFTLSVE